MDNKKLLVVGSDAELRSVPSVKDAMLKPQACVNRLEDIDTEKLWQAGVRGLILDLDNTLLAYGCDELPPQRAAWVEAAKRRGFAIVIISNNFPERVGRVGNLLNIPSVPNALKPLPFAYLRALRVLGIPRRQTLMIGDQLLTDLLGATLVGVPGILTEPLAPHDFPLTRVLRFLERRLLGRKEPRREA